MPLRNVMFIVAPLVGVVALGAVAYYANRAPATVQGEVSKSGLTGPEGQGAAGAGKGPGGIAVTVETAPVATARLRALRVSSVSRSL